MPWKKGQSGNPKGRPREGTTLKQYAAEYLKLMTLDEKDDFLEKLSPDVIWRMAEGNPHQTQDHTTKGEKITPIYGGLSRHNSDKESIQAEQED